MHSEDRKWICCDKIIHIDSIELLPRIIIHHFKCPQCGLVASTVWPAEVLHLTPFEAITESNGRTGREALDKRQDELMGQWFEDQMRTDDK